MKQSLGTEVSEKSEQEVTKMTKHDEMHKVVLGALAAMMVASLLLAVVAFTLPMPVQAAGPQPDGCPQGWYEVHTAPCGTCPNNQRFFWWEFCQEDVCAGVPKQCSTCYWCNPPSGCYACF